VWFGEGWGRKTPATRFLILLGNFKFGKCGNPKNGARGAVAVLTHPSLKNGAEILLARFLRTSSQITLSDGFFFFTSNPNPTGHRLERSAAAAEYRSTSASELHPPST
jgi:hypothetical protein